MSVTGRFLAAAALVAFLVVMLAGCGGGDPLPDNVPALADTGVPTPRVDCTARPEACA